MRKMLKMSIAAAMVMGIGSVSAQADGVDIVSNVSVKGEIRARYEMVDSDAGTDQNANAFTNRLKIGVAGDLLGTDWLSAYVEMTDVRAINDNYDDTNNDNGNEANQVVADPEQTRVTQAYVDAKFGNTNVRLGRQMINLDNQRFVGAVGWRQMFQTFDAVTVTNSDIENLSLFGSYVTQINRVFDEKDSDGSGKRDTRTLLLNASYKVMPELKVTGYSYMIGEGTAGGGTDTHGIALTGNVALDGMKVNYRAEYAMQDDPSMEASGYNGAAQKADADYMRIDLGMNMGGILAGIGYESLSGANASGSETAFATPLATLHGKNGWNDQFLATPAGGIEDTSVYVGYKSKDFGLLKVVYHSFDAESSQSTDYGTEIDAVYKRGIPGVKNLGGLIKLAAFDADTNNVDGKVDTTKVWAMLTYKFASK